jgi:hypothetical protein
MENLEFRKIIMPLPSGVKQFHTLKIKYELSTRLAILVERHDFASR